MTGAFRAAIVSFAVMLLLFGATSVAIACFAHLDARARVSGVLGGGVTLALGTLLLRAVTVRRGPHWLLRFLDQLEGIE